MFFVRIMNDMKIRKKLAITFITAAGIPLLLCGLFLTARLREVVVQSTLVQVSNNVDRVQKRTAELIKVPLDISNRLMNDNQMKKTASQTYNSYTEVIQQYHNYTNIREYIQLYKEISGIRIYAINPGALNNWEFMQPTQKLLDQIWYQQAIAQKGVVGWNMIQDERTNAMELSLIRSFPLAASEQKGVMVINVNKQRLSAILEQESFPTFIVDSENQLVASNSIKGSEQEASTLYSSNDILSLAEGSYNISLDGKDSKVVVATLQPNDSWNSLRMISVFSIAEITRDANYVIFLGAIVIASSLIVATFLTYASALLLSRRLQRLSHHVDNVRSGSWKTFLHIDGNDEIGVLSRQFNALVKDIDRLFHEVQTTNREKSLIEQRQNEMKFKMLASQINPHFLFNALESIRMEAHIRQQDDIAQVVWLLSTLLRSSLETNSDMILLETELKYVQGYLDIQKFRYEDRLQYQLTIEPEIQKIRVPPLIIQPLVENAIIHGLDHRAEGGQIRVEVTQIIGGAQIQVSDNGTGFSAERLESVQQELASPANDSKEQRIGLRNVNDRLVLLYGQASILHIKSSYGSGTTITFIVPGGDDID
ncbi:sensor histidine kinase [Paenibacillus sp. PK4536]|uniref:sensor histidine kinase n=1 Tax=Paenibacillus sp. PK4536 TaxID=3024576 RepID=UPI0023588D4F|nr:sensor histidine kinase [Paenibacillus sp. PK4536]WIM39742.1 sensor histidine kinase [Paenibacillus sp. PK4536]